MAKLSFVVGSVRLVMKGGKGQLLVLHAVGQVAYRERSHFDAQQLLESGGERPFALPTGWLGRALQLADRGYVMESGEITMSGEGKALLTDPKVQAAVEQYAAQAKIPMPEVFRVVEGYAREIVPAFNAYLYFRIGYWIGRKVAQGLYRVRLGYVDAEALKTVPENATSDLMA